MWPPNARPSIRTQPVPQDRQPTERLKYLCSECQEYLLDMNTVYKHMDEIHLKRLGLDQSDTPSPGQDHPSISRSTYKSVTTSRPTPTATTSYFANSSTGMQQLNTSTRPSAPSSIPQTILSSASPSPYHFPSWSSSPHHLEPSAASMSSSLPEVNNSFAGYANSNAPVCGSVYDHRGVLVNASSESMGSGSEMANLFGTEMGMGTMVDGAAQGAWHPEPMVRMENWRGEETQHYPWPSTVVGASTLVPPAPSAHTIETTSASTTPWSLTPTQASPATRPSHKAEASPMLPPSVSLKKTSQRRREVKVEEAKLASSKPKLEKRYKCERPGCRKSYKTLNGLKNHLSKWICIPAFEPSANPVPIPKLTHAVSDVDTAYGFTAQLQAPYRQLQPGWTSSSTSNAALQLQVPYGTYPPQDPGQLQLQCPASVPLPPSSLLPDGLQQHQPILSVCYCPPCRAAAAAMQASTHIQATAFRHREPEVSAVHYPGSNSSADAHAVAPLGQHQQWQASQRQTQQEHQHFQVQDAPSAPLSASPPPPQHFAASRSRPRRSTPAVQAAVPTFPAPTMPQQAVTGATMRVSLPRAKVNALFQLAQIEKELLQRKTRGM